KTNNPNHTPDTHLGPSCDGHRHLPAKHLQTRPYLGARLSHLNPDSLCFPFRQVTIPGSLMEVSAIVRICVNSNAILWILSRSHTCGYVERPSKSEYYSSLFADRQ